MHEDHLLPPDDPLRLAPHNEVHARPPARIRLPALIVQTGTPLPLAAYAERPRA